jgi:hypothetical protein
MPQVIPEVQGKKLWVHSSVSLIKRHIADEYEVINISMTLDYICPEGRVLDL